jgi:NAD(P)-dependent dehydrogenase (short-subunit alcohol dehydrogenase family)
MKVVLADVEEDALAKAENKIKATGAATLAVKTDVSKADDVKALADKTLDAFGAVDLLVNNAGVAGGPFAAWQTPLLDWKWVLGVNLWGVIHGIHYFVPTMIKQNTECHIVNTASVAGLTANPGADAYLVSKHSVVALSEVLYRELKQGGPKVGISVLCPGIINTNILDADRNRPPELKNAPGEEPGDISDPKALEMLQTYREIFKKGMPPLQVADIVFSAIREKKFYILPNADPYRPSIRARMEDIVQERNPTDIQLDLT